MRFRLTLNKIAHSVFIYPTLRKCISLRQHVVQKRRKSYLEKENKTNYLKCKKVRKKNLFTSVWTLCPVSFFFSTSYLQHLAVDKSQLSVWFLLSNWCSAEKLFFSLSPKSRTLQQITASSRGRCCWTAGCAGSPWEPRTSSPTKLNSGKCLVKYIKNTYIQTHILYISVRISWCIVSLPPCFYSLICLEALTCHPAPLPAAGLNDACHRQWLVTCTRAPTAGRCPPHGN